MKIRIADEGPAKRRGIAETAGERSANIYSYKVSGTKSLKVVNGIAPVEKCGRVVCREIAGCSEL